jgi:lysophospholipase L1-like esterase
LGDSIAVGIHQAKPQCEMIAKVGINSKDWNKQNLRIFYSEIVIISLGTNDYRGLNTVNELEKLRACVWAKRVYWIMPNKPGFDQTGLAEFAKTHGDIILRTNKVSKDHIHPTGDGYNQLAKEAI